MGLRPSASASASASEPQDNRAEYQHWQRILPARIGAHPWDEAWTPREREVAQLVTRGVSNRRIGETLVIAEKNDRVPELL